MSMSLRWWVRHYAREARYLHLKVWFFLQRRFRGFGDDDLCSLDHHLATLILPRLVAFRRASSWFAPADMEEDTWLAIIDEMIWTFHTLATYWDDDGAWLDDDKGEINRRIDKGLELFAKYFRYLWT